MDETNASEPAHLVSNVPARPPGRSRLISILIQVAGILVACAALAWVVHLAMEPANREALRKLQDITLGQGSAIAALTILSFVLNGMCFWACVRQRHSIPPVEMVATNFLGCLLAEVPFKLSAIFRVFVHHRRDRVPLLTIGAWFAAVALGMLLVVGPLTGLSLWRKDIDSIWLIGVLAGVPALACGTMAAAGYFSGPQGLGRLEGLSRILPGKRLQGLAENVFRSRPFGQLHAGCDMVASRFFAVGLVFRAADVIVQSFRFLLVARLLGVGISFGNSLFLSGSYFLIGVLAPSGSAGSREGGVTAVARLLDIPAWRSIAPVALTVGAFELFTLLAFAPFGILLLKPWRFMRSTTSHVTASPLQTPPNLP